MEDIRADVEPTDYIITRKRKKYRFALFARSPLCYELHDWDAKWRPSVVEVGAGTGIFGVAMASRCDEKIVAVDVKGDRLQKGANMAMGENLENIRFLRARADQIGDAIKHGTIESLWVTFPDPFPKKRAAKHRLTHPRFLKVYAALLSPSGSLYFKTDASPLFEWSLEQLVDQGWKVEELTFNLHESALPQNYKIMTTYETRFHNEGLPIQFVRATPPR